MFSGANVKILLLFVISFLSGFILAIDRYSICEQFDQSEQLPTEYADAQAIDTVYIRDLSWQVVRVEMQDDWGQCDPPSSETRQIRIHTELSGKHELEIFLHEFLHAAFWDIDEEVVASVAVDYSNALWNLGYRRADLTCETDTLQ